MTMTVLTEPDSITEAPPGPEPPPRSATGRTTARARQAGAKVAKRSGAHQPATTEGLLQARARLPAGHPDREILRVRAIEDNLPMSRRLARRYIGRGERFDDLTQVAALALIRAVDGYDPRRPFSFASYAVPTIVGALKRHFRDTAWAIHVPRSVQQLASDIRAATDDLEQRHGRIPTPADLAAHLDVGLGAITDAIGAAQVYRLVSLNTAYTANGAIEIVDMVGQVDPRLAGIDERLSRGLLSGLVAALPPRKQRILALRFSEERTQSSIAAELGVSQMHVSRLLRQTLEHLRVGLSTGTVQSAEEDLAHARR